MSKETATESKVYEQAENEAGRMRLDRPFSPEEAAAQDKENLAKLGDRAQLAVPFKDEPRPRR